MYIFFLFILFSILRDTKGDFYFVRGYDAQSALYNLQLSICLHCMFILFQNNTLSPILHEFLFLCDEVNIFFIVTVFTRSEVLFIFN